MTKSIIEAYQFCPVCGGKFQKKETNLLVCASCSFQYFINPKPCAAAIISDENERILLVKRKYEPKKGFWDLPGGFMNLGENIDISIKREIREELCVEIEITGFVGGFADSSEYQEILYPVYTTVISGKIIKGTPIPHDDVSEYAFFSYKDFLNQEIAFPSLRDAVKEYFKQKFTSE